MRTALTFCAWLLALALFIPALAIACAAIALNTGAGRAFAVREINAQAAPSAHIIGLAGHFPADLKVAQVSLSDSQGVYATASDLQLRWLPLRLLSRDVAVTAVTADDVAVLRRPLPTASKSSSGSSGLPPFRLNIDLLKINHVRASAAVAGDAVDLAVTGQAHLRNLSAGTIALDAAAANGLGAYHVAAVIDPDILSVHAVIAEPAGGLISHYAAPQLHEPLHVDLTLAGPRDDANLAFTSSLGAARLDGAGMIGLDPASPRADVTFTIPSLGPAAALAGASAAGSGKVRVVAAQEGGVARIAVDGHVDLTAGPGPAAKLVGQNGQFMLRMTLASQAASIESLVISGAGFDAAMNGRLSRAGMDFHAHAALANTGALSPRLSGPVALDGDLAGPLKDFAVRATLKGDISNGAIPSGPFLIAVDAAHLPAAPAGTITGSGALENATLALDAAFSQNAAGGLSLVISRASWRSLAMQASLTLPQGASLPTGGATFSIGTLADFSNFSPLKLRGSLKGDFSHRGAQNLALNLTASRLAASPAIGAIDAQMSASGPISALAVKFSAASAGILHAPARLAFAGIASLTAQSASLTTLSASWRGVSATLLGPASIETKPGVAVHHLALALAGGTITLDGPLTPRLNAALDVNHLPASLASLAAPAIAATGMLTASAQLTGTSASPTGTISLAADDIRLHQGLAAALPPAQFNAKITLAGRTAGIDASLSLGAGTRLSAAGAVPFGQTGAIALRLTGTTDLRLLDPILAAQGSTLRGVIAPDLMITGTPAAPAANGTVTLTGGAAQNADSGLNLTQISAHITAAGRLITLQNLQATAGAGTITAHGSIDLASPRIPINLALNADHATPVSSDLATETLNAALTLQGEALGAMALGGSIDLLGANIQIPKSLPPGVANLPIINEGETPKPPPPPPPPVTLNLTINADNRIFIRGDGLFAELGGKIHIAGTAADPAPTGGFTLIRGNFALAGKSLQFTQGTVNFTGDGFMPTLDLEATTPMANNGTASLIIGGTAADPTVTLTASPPLPSDEVLSQLLFGEATASLSPFQAASLAAALASLAGVGGSAISDPLGGVRQALGLDELSLGGSGSGAPTVNAGRYVAPGIYVGAQQSTTGQGTQATVQINLYKGLQLQTTTGTAGASGGASSSVGLTYQFNY